jgi:hypothetical protein
MCHADEYRCRVYNQAAYFILTMREMHGSCEPKDNKQQIASDHGCEGHKK